jgi:GT2 family glycosyltransferase
VTGATPGRGGAGDVTVVVMTRDRREPVLATLARLVALPGPPPVILVDNGSQDGTVDAVRARFPAVAVIALPVNRGAAARTAGVRAARTPYVAFSDDDSWWAPGALERAAAVFDAHPRLGLLAARILVGPQDRLDPVCRLMTDGPLRQRAGDAGVPVLGFVACGSVVRRTAYLSVGGFSDVIFFFGEETVLAQDLAAHGWDLAYVPDVVAHHHPQAAGPRSGRRRLQIRNRLLSTWLRRPWPVVARDTLGVAAGLRDPDHRGALVDAARRLPAALRARRSLPPQVERQVRLLERAG